MQFSNLQIGLEMSMTQQPKGSDPVVAYVEYMLGICSMLNLL